MGNSTSRSAERLGDAISRGDARTAEQLLSAANANHRRGMLSYSGEQGPALHVAARAGLAVCTRVLLQYGAPVDEFHAGCKPLHLGVCASRNAPAVVQLLLDAGADVSSRTQVTEGGGGGDTPLHWAVERADSVGFCRALLSRGAAVDASNVRGCTPLMFAAQYHYAATTVAALLEAGADARARAFDGRTAIVCAALVGCADTLPSLLNAGADPQQYFAGVPVLAMLAATPDGNEAAAAAGVRVLLAAGADPDARAASGATALYCAAEAGNGAAVLALMEGGADPNIPCGIDRFFETPLHVASKLGYDECVSALLRRPLPGLTAGATARIPSDAHDGVGGPTASATPIRVADTSSLDSDGYIPLHLAVVRGYIAVVQMLLAAGAAVDTPDAVGETPLMLAVKRAVATITREPPSRSPPGAEAAEDAQETGLRQIVAATTAMRLCSILVDAGADVNAKGRASCETPLGMAASKLCVPVVRWLVSRGAQSLPRCRCGGGAACCGSPLDLVAAAISRSAGSQVASDSRRSVLRILALLHQAAAAAGVPTEDSFVGTVQLRSLTALLGPSDALAFRLLQEDATATAEVAAPTWLPVHVAAARGDARACYDAVGALGVSSVSSRTGSGATPLLLASAGGHAAAVAALLAGGASRRSPNHCGTTALHAAAAGGHLGVVSALLAAAPEPDGSLVCRACPGDFEAGGTPGGGLTSTLDLLDASGFTPLHLAAAGGHAEVCRALIAAGASGDDGSGGDWLRGGVEYAFIGSAAVSAATRPWVIAVQGRPGRARNPRKSPAALAAQAGHASLAVELIEAVGARHGPALAARDSESAAWAAAESGAADACIAALNLFPRVLSAAKRAPAPGPNSPRIVSDLPTHWDLLEASRARAAAAGSVDVTAALLGGRTGSLELHRPKTLVGWAQPWTALHSASAGGHASVVRELLTSAAESDMGATPATNSETLAPLEVAAIFGHTDIVTTLLDRTAGSSSVERALLLAARAGSDDACFRLLDSLPVAAQPAALSARDAESGMSLLDCAAWGGAPRFLGALIARGLAPPANAKDGVPPLVDCAVLGGSAAGLAAVLEIRRGPMSSPVLLETAPSDFHSALMLAAELDDPAALRMLLGSAIAIESEGSDNRQAALRHAAMFGSERAIAAFLEGTPRLEGQQHAGGDALRAAVIIASTLGHARVLQQLLAAGGDANARNSDGGTALSAAAHGGHDEAVAALLAAGANPSPADSSSQVGGGAPRAFLTPLMEALVGGVAAPGSDDDFAGVSLARLRCLRLLLAAGADTAALSHFPDGGAAPPLVAAVERRSVAAVAALLAAGADPCVGRSDGVTPVHVAAAMVQARILRMLLAAGAADVINRPAAGFNGFTPLVALVAIRGGRGEARVSNGRGWPEPHPDQVQECLNLLVRHGAEVPLPREAA